MCDCECGDEGVSPTRRESAYDMLRVEAAVELMLQQAQPLGAARVPAHEADGFVLAEPVHSIVRIGDSIYFNNDNNIYYYSVIFVQEPLPPFRASIMDGYAVVAADGVGTVGRFYFILPFFY